MLVVLTLVCLWAAGILLTMPTLCCGNPDPQATTPQAIATDVGVALEAAVAIVTSLTVCVVYVFLAFMLVRHAAGPASDDGRQISCKLSGVVGWAWGGGGGGEWICGVNKS